MTELVGVSTTDVNFYQLYNRETPASGLPVTRNLALLIIEKRQLGVAPQRQLLCISLTVQDNGEK